MRRLSLLSSTIYCQTTEGLETLKQVHTAAKETAIPAAHLAILTVRKIESLAGRFSSRN